MGRKKIFYLLFVSVFFSAQQFKVLPATSTARFTNKNRVWSTVFGNVSVCQWKDDKLATVSVTIDDNHYQPDNAYWMQKASETGWKWTWFLIPSRIVSNPTYNGSWAQWKVVKAAGHDLQSHSQNHCSTSVSSQDLEYSLAKTNINNNITGANVQTLAYPNGYPGCNNDSVVAKKYYLSSRGVYGAVPDVTKINFHNVNSVGNFNGFFNAESDYSSFTGALNPANTTKFRTWYVALFHNLTNAIKTQIGSVFTYLKKNESNIWVATYTDAAKYAEEFATCSVPTVDMTPNQISFVLKDKMYNAWYDHPLTVKVNITGWNIDKVTQNGSIINYKIVTNGANTYALVDAIPDKGTVVITKKSSTSASYCVPNVISSSKILISRVKIGNINNYTSGTKYTYYSSISSNVPKGNNVLTLKSWSSYTNPTYFYKVWIDYNQNKTFETNELILNKSLSAIGENNYNFTIPTTALTGNTRMRVMLSKDVSPESCIAINEGEVEDYNLNIVAAGTARNDMNDNFDYTKTENQSLIQDYDFYEIYDYQMRIVKRSLRKEIFDYSQLPSGHYVVVFLKNNQKIGNILIKK